MLDQAQLPFIDAYAVEVNAPPERIWDELAHRVLRRFLGGAGRLGPIGARIVGCPYSEAAPPGRGVPETIIGFRVQAAERPSLVALAGEHRYSTYSLTLRIEPVDDDSACRVTAETRAAFPGPAGRVYRKIVIGTGGHVIVVRSLLASVKRRAERH